MAMRPWPALDDEDRWLADALERQLGEGDRSPDELRERARELRQQGADSDVKGTQDASLALAERYEAAAEARLSTR